MIYTLMHKNIPVVDVNISTYGNNLNDISQVYHAEHLPAGAASEGKVDEKFMNTWWSMRTIPASRPGLGEALEALHLDNRDALLTKGLGLSLSDQYWICSKDRTVDWQEVNFFDNAFSLDVGDALFGRDVGKEYPDLASPDVTSDGWLKKRWIIQDEKRVLVKAGHGPFFQEPFNEVIASAIMERLAVPHVNYKLASQGTTVFSLCENFISADTDLVPAWMILGFEKRDRTTSQYQHYLNRCKKNGINNITPALEKMITVDYIMGNTDRHYSNFGMIRDANTLKWLGPAPIYDTGNSLWYDQSRILIHSYDAVKSMPFKSSQAEQIKLVKDFSWIDFTVLKDMDKVCASVLAKNSALDQQRIDSVSAAMKMRITRLEEGRGMPPSR